MKGFVKLILTAAMLLTFSTSAFAANAVSQMASTDGGQAIAKCAQAMQKGISECARMTVCQ